MATIILRLLLCILIVDSASSQQQQKTCPKFDLSIPRREVNHGSLKGFFAIAKGISDTIQPKISAELVQKITTGASDSALSFEKMEPEIKSLLGKQVGTLIFFGFGILVALISFFSGLSILVSRCCCGTKLTASKSTSVARCTILLLLIPAFIFLCTGVVINKQSSTRLFKSVERSRGFVKESKTNLLNLYDNVVKSVKCEVSSQLDKAVEKVRKIATTVPQALLNDAKEQFGLSGLEQATVKAMLDEMKAASEACRSIKKPLNDLEGSAASAKDIKCVAQLHAVGAIVLWLDNQVKDTDKYVDIGEKCSTSGSTYKDLEQKINSYIDGAATNIHNIGDEIIGRIEKNSGIPATMDSAEKTVIEAINWITSSKPYTVVKSEFSLLVTIPGIITILFIIFTAALSVVYLHFSRASSKIANGTITDCCFKIQMIGFYIIIFFGSIILTLSSVEYLIGALFSGGCKTFFEDDSLSVFSSLNREVEIWGGKLDLNARDILIQCQDNKPLLAVINAKSIIGPDQLLKEINLPQLKENFLKKVDYLKSEISSILSKISDMKKTANELKSGPDNTELVPGSSISNLPINLDGCDKLDKHKTEAVESQLRTIKTSIENLKNGMTEVIELLDKVNLSADIDKKILAIAGKSFDKFQNALEDEVNKIEDELTAKLLPCGGIYTIYKNLGTYVCQDVAGPVHGIWASAGLCGLCLIFTAMIIFGIDRMASTSNSSGR